MNATGYVVAALFATSLCSVVGCSDSDTGGSSSGSTSSGASSSGGSSSSGSSSGSTSSSGATGGKTGDQCRGNGDCSSRSCLGKSGAAFGYCTNVCDSFADCPAFWDCTEVGNASAKYCVQK